MNCPRCGERFEPHIDPAEEFQEYQDITFECPNEHRYWVRVKEADLIED